MNWAVGAGTAPGPPAATPQLPLPPPGVVDCGSRDSDSGECGETGVDNESLRTAGGRGWWGVGVALGACRGVRRRQSRRPIDMARLTASLLSLVPVFR